MRKEGDYSENYLISSNTSRGYYYFQTALTRGYNSKGGNNLRLSTTYFAGAIYIYIYSMCMIVGIHVLVHVIYKM